MIQTKNATVYLGNNLDILPTLPDNSVDSIVTDPPYELGFMGKSWDSSGIAYSTELWTECLRVLKPGGHLLSFGGSRTWHRIAVAIEDSGFTLRDSIAWMYGSGFPKSHNLKDEWKGWGTALKPAFEPIIVARNPMTGTVAENVSIYGTGALNIDGSRIGTETITINTFDNGAKPFGGAVGEPYTSRKNQGRWPANVILDEYTAGLLDEQFDASRFFYCSKASKRDRNDGLEGLAVKGKVFNGQNANSAGLASGSVEDKFTTQPSQNFHPTVKPTDLMRYLVKLVTPPNGIVLDPFTGSGSTGKAAILEKFKFIGIEMTEEYLPIIKGRLEFAEQHLQSSVTLFEV